MKINHIAVESEPFVTLTAEEVEKSNGLSVARIYVEGPTGEIARFWLTATIKKGRPVLQLTTKHLSSLGDREVSKSVTGTFNQL